MSSKEPRGELGSWVRARRHRNRAAESLRLAENAMVPAARERYFSIAQHFLALAEAEQRSTEQTAAREDNSHYGAWLSTRRGRRRRNAPTDQKEHIARWQVLYRKQSRVVTELQRNDVTAKPRGGPVGFGIGQSTVL